MPHHKSNKKRLITAEKSRVRNRHIRSTIISVLKKMESSSSKEDIQATIPSYFNLLDKAARRNQGGFTSNKVARFKSKAHKLLAAQS